MSIILANKINVPASTTPMVEVVTQTGNAVTYTDEEIFFGHKYSKTGYTPLTLQYKFINAPADQIYTKKSVYVKTNGAGPNTCMPLYKNLVRKNADGGYRYTTLNRDYSEIMGTDGTETVVRNLNNTTMDYNEVLWTSTIFDIVVGTVIATANARYLYILNNIDSTAQIAIDSTTYSEYMFLSEDATNVYILATRQNGLMAVITVNKSTKVATVATASGSTSLITGPITTQYVKQKVVDVMVQNDGTYKWCVFYYLATVMYCRVISYNPTAVGTDAIAKMTVADYTVSGTIPTPTTGIHTLVYKAIDADTMAVGYVTQGYGTVIGSVAYSMFGVLVVSFDHTNKVATIGSLTQATELEPLCPLWDTVNTLYFVSKTGFSKLVYDSTNKKYVKLTEVACSPVSVGLDNSGIVWVFDTNNILRMYTPFAIKRLSTTCDTKNVVYTGTDIDVIAYTSVYNYEGNRMATSVRLTIYGDGVFKSNGLKTITVTSSTVSEVATTVTIKGPTTIQVVGEASGTVSS